MCLWWPVAAVLSVALMLTSYMPLLLPGLFCFDLPWWGMLMPLPPFTAFFVFRKNHDMPWFLSWLGQWDDNLRANREGANWTNKSYVKWLRALPAKMPFAWLKKIVWALATWFEAVLWIIRNPAQHGDYWLIGQVIKPGWEKDGTEQSFSITVYGNPNVGDKPLVPGWCVKILQTGDRQIINARAVLKIPFTKIHLHAWGGWQFPDKAKEIKPNSKAQVKASLGLCW